MRKRHFVFLVCALHYIFPAFSQDVGSTRRFNREDERITLDTSLFLRESPHFGLPIQTVTVNVGQTARLTCFVQNLGDYEVAWMNKETNAVLSMGETVITKDSRMSVQREQRSTWILTITNVTIQDHGYYTCNINTQPPTSIQGFLDVVEPPVLEDGDEEVWVMEGMTALLSCLARGTPSPTYKWIREDYNTIRINSSTFVSNWVGRNLTLQHANHRSAGGYLCIASNGYPPSVSKRVLLHVYFAPLVRGPGMEIRSSLGQSVSLTCLYAAHPSPTVVWVRDNDIGVQQLTEEYFTVTPQDGHPPYTHNMTLKMRKLVESDFGRYTCVITNSQGEASYTTILSEVITTAAPITSTKPPPETTSSFPNLASGATSQTSPIYNNYDDDTKNLSAPLIINMKPDIYRGDPGVQPARSREQPFNNRKSKNIARINLMDTNRDLNAAPPRSSMKSSQVLTLLLLIWYLLP